MRRRADASPHFWCTRSGQLLAQSGRADELLSWQLSGVKRTRSEMPVVS